MRRTNKCKWRKGVALVLSAVMTVTSAPFYGVSGVQEKAKADAQNPVDTKEITGLGTGAIGNPTTASGSAPWTGSYVYYGKYNDNSMKFRVLANDTKDYNASGDTAATHTMFLDCDNVLLPKAYQEAGSSSAWTGSDIKSWLQGDSFYTNANVFTALEKGAIKPATHEAVTGSNQEFALSSDEVFILGANEASTSAYGYVNDNSRKKENANGCSAYGWWLRSSGSDYGRAGCVYGANGLS